MSDGGYLMTVDQKMDMLEQMIEHIGEVNRTLRAELRDEKRLVVELNAALEDARKTKPKRGICWGPGPRNTFTEKDRLALIASIEACKEAQA